MEPRPASGAPDRRSSSGNCRVPGPVRGILLGLAAVAVLYLPARWFLDWIAALPQAAAEATATALATAWVCFWLARRASRRR
ncbi:MAG: hypothetical protein OXN97_14795 [Bryobacterales bacterium]|nr:hypothetical protein [Bryobacterales bacterium]